MMQELLTGRTRLPVGGCVMSDVGQIERKTQDRVVKLFRDQLGYEYLGNWEYREDNSNVESRAAYVRTCAPAATTTTSSTRRSTSSRRPPRSAAASDLYEANREVYDLLRYGVKVKPDVGEQTETVWLIDWNNPDANHFVVAEEVTVLGQHTKRPDLVLYVNGIALGVIELKRSKVAVSEGIRQTIGNQKPRVHPAVLHDGPAA